MTIWPTARPPALLLALAIGLAGCATRGGGDPAGELRDLTALLVGDYFSAADGGAREDRPIYLRIRRVDPPPGQPVALYAEMRHDGPAGEMYRQRLYLFDATPSRDGLAMWSLGFADAEAAARLVDDPGLLRREGLGTTDPLGAGCVTRWTRTAEGFTGLIDPQSCVIVGKRGDQRRIEGRTTISRAAIGQLERGYDMEGRLLFGNPTGDLYIWPRVR
jgi:hypothetical protein